MPRPTAGCSTACSTDAQPMTQATQGSDVKTFVKTYVELHAHSAFSFLRAGSGVEALVARAAELGMAALALTDTMTLAGAVRFQAACAEQASRPILGCELAVADPVFGDVAQPARLVVLAENATGYARLCQLLTDANLADPDAPSRALRGAGRRAGGADRADRRARRDARAPAARRAAPGGRERVAQRYRRAFGPRARLRRGTASPARPTRC